MVGPPFVAGLWVWRRRPRGYALAVVWNVKGVGHPLPKPGGSFSLMELDVIALLLQLVADPSLQIEGLYLRLSVGGWGRSGRDD